MPLATILRKVAVRESFSPAYQTYMQCHGISTCHDLCWQRAKKVHYRGTIPCDVLFIGEGPGESEDSIGLPFIGPAGNQLDSIIEQAFIHSGLTLSPTFGFANLVACIRLNDEGGIRQPTKKEIVACQYRLVDLVSLAQPGAIVLCGLLSQKHFPRSTFVSQYYAEIVHPAAIIRNEEPQEQRRMVKESYLKLSDLFKLL